MASITATDRQAPRRPGTAEREQVRRAVRLLDSQFRLPGTKRRFGIDGLLGLVPGLGDAAGLALASAVIVRAIGLGARGATVARMVLNAALDASVGSIPILGSVFDFAFKANSRNLALLERHLVDPDAARVESAASVRRTVIGAIVALLVVTAALLALVVWVVSRLF